MPLPNPTMSFTPFDILTAEELNDLVENIESLQDWTAFDNDTFPIALIEDGTVSSEKLNTTIAARAYRNAAQAILSGAARKVLLDTENFDVGGDFDLANSRFVAPVTGYYEISGSVQYLNLDAAGQQGLCYIYVNGVLAAGNSGYVGAANGDPTASITTLEFVNAGEFIELYTQHDSATASESLVVTRANTFLAVHFIGE